MKAANVAEVPIQGKGGFRHFFHIAFCGRNYHGWQRLPHNTSIQNLVEKALCSVMKKQVGVVGCGRTDTGVHASQYFFHADLESPVTDEMVFRLNKNLPPDIAVFDVIPVASEHHARFSAAERTYTYFIHHTKDPFLDSLSSFYQNCEVDLIKMKEAAMLLPLERDYSQFHRLASRPNTTICHVTDVKLFVNKTGDRIKFIISANRFLSGMVRIILYRLLDVAKRKISVEQFANYLHRTEIPFNRKSAYPQGLYLSEVRYPFLHLPCKSTFFNLVDKEEVWVTV
ncbi:MAG TPA: tRNA pseudouridine(38-40) synthase TruA [Chryseosolibacter sp.]